MKNKFMVKMFATVIAAGCLSGSVSTGVNAAVLTTKDQLYREIHDQLNARKKSFKVEMKGSQVYGISSSLNTVIDKALAIDDKSTTDDGAYLSNARGYISISTLMSGDSLTLTINAEYKENAKQLKKVNSKVKSIIKGLKLDGKTKRQKIRAINDWIVDHVEYDDTLSRYTAYTALFGNKETVCQGYAMLAYKLVNEAGIPCEIVSGQADNGLITDNHAWNIVKVGSKWYVLDVCWNDTSRSDGYFLLGSKNAGTDHFLDAEYKTKAFKDAHPMSNRDYE